MNRVICSGLGPPCCEKRERCANYVHWTVDPRSEFNACKGEPYKHFVPIGFVPIAAQAVNGQGCLF